MSKTIDGLDELLGKGFDVYNIEYGEDGQKKYVINVAPLKDYIRGLTKECIPKKKYPDDTWSYNSAIKEITKNLKESGLL